MILIINVLIILIATKIAGEISIRLRQPPVLGKLIIGVVIGPAILSWIEPSELITQVSEVGVILLMFITGLETDINTLNKERISSLSVALGGIVLPLIGGYLCAKYIGLDNAHAIFIGLLLSATSVSITAQTLKELGQLKSRESTTIMGAALVDDIVVVILLAFVMSLYTTQDISVGMVIGKKIFFFTCVSLIGWKIVPWIMEKLEKIKVSEPIASMALIICFGFAYLADLLGMASIIGAFIAGMSISKTHYKQTVVNKVESIAYAFFVPVFFVSIGLVVTFKNMGDQISIIICLSIIAILTKLIGAAIGAKLTGYNSRSSLVIGTGMISRGEVALILAAIGLESKLLMPEYFTMIVSVVILTTLVTPVLLKVLINNPLKETTY